MNVPELFFRMAELTDESLLAELIRGNRVRVRDKWYTVGARDGKVVLLDDDGSDYSFSDLSVIEEVQWVEPKDEIEVKVQPKTSGSVPNQNIADVLSQLGKR